MSLLVDALREKYSSPAEVMRALGLPTAILGYDAGRPRRARDEEPQPEPESAGDPAEQLHRILSAKFSPDEIKAIAELLERMAGGSEEGEESEERADGDPRPGMQDHDDFEEDEAAPETERMFQSRSVGRSPQLGRTAMDAKAAKSFAERYPGAARIATDGGLWACRPDHGAVRKPQSAAQRAAFDARFPNLKRVA